MALVGVGRFWKRYNGSRWGSKAKSFKVASQYAAKGGPKIHLRKELLH